ncbi:hypothetical protein PDIG_83800 [Penicillium digitatum PHI26]|uniref:ERT1/acuK family PAS domain-containing protein n=2 Tax=Penicillium digitatum TaxID=36651 RepID=K9FWJ3_PEND2|nr:hypothetical protein PDIP_89290 [Penicillium digitatum Pd1]EKV04023.1 hypothetical protein PDIP_89290 [Penicillium digitatum Pd1]EKV05401.1 hypothetical protein PDIG_83800 [Penicillium digitatum PHI26]
MPEKNAPLGASNATKSRSDAGKDTSIKNSQTSAAKAETTGSGSHSSPKKRRKVNHADLSESVKERPCTRCIKRNIGHLCHDEPRETAKRGRGEHENSAADDEGSSNNEVGSVQGMPRSVDVADAAGQQPFPDTTIGITPSAVNPPSTVPPGNLSASSQGLEANSQLMQYNDWVGGQNQFQDMHSLHPSYMFNAHEVTNEYNLLGDFLSNSLLDDGAMFQNQDMQGIYTDSSLMNSVNGMALPNGLPPPAQLPPPAKNQVPQGESIQPPNSTVGNDKARETYYMTAADPAGTDPPEERMNKLLKAKYDAGLLKPFNYVKGYARLNQYMEKNMQQISRQKILRQLDKFRPKFRERMQSLTDIELILVEMWFERSLMEYDRVFASMAIPACCWRRTGEIFRGNNEMAQLIDVPVEGLRDGKLAIHEIIVEDQLVSYWEKFGAIAFDNTQKAMLTSCTLKSPNPKSTNDGITCCFSFTIRRDNHNINPFCLVTNTANHQQLDAIGTLLWNDCTDLMISRGHNPEDVLLLGKVRALAFAILNQAVLPDLLGNIRALDLALKAARICIVNQQREIALNILSVAALRLASVQPVHLGLDPAINRTLTTRYFLLRIRLAWLQDRVDIAEHFFAKLPRPVVLNDEELIFETCFIIGDSALARRLPDVAITWLQRAKDHLEPLSIMAEMNFADYHKWNLLVRHSLVVACAQVKSPQAIFIYDVEMRVLRDDYPKHPAMVLFNLFVGQNNPSNEELLQGLKSLVEETLLTDMNMPIIFQFARSLGHTGGSDHGMEAFRILLMRPLPTREWTEKCFVAFLLLLSRSDISDSKRIRNLRCVIDTLEKRGYPSIGAKAAHATVIVGFAITLLSQELSKGFSQRLGNSIETVTQSALSFAKENSMFEGGDQEVSVTQLQWLYFSAYKLALELVNSSGVLWATSVLDHSRDFAIQYRQIAYPEMGSRAPRPHFFAVAYLRILVTSLKARCEDDPAERTSHYESVRACFQELDELHGWEDEEEETDDDANYKEDRRYDIAQFFDLEAAMYLKQWDDVANMCASDDAFPDLEFYAPVMDLTLQLNLPPTLAIQIIKRVVSKLSELQDDPPSTWQRDFRVSLPRYLHCLFILATAPAQGPNSHEIALLDVNMADPKVAEEVLDKVLAMADKEGAVKEGGHNALHDPNIIQAGSELCEVFTYPAAELIKIATVAFNKATDFYRATQDDDCQRWANKAISIAQLVPGAQGKQLVKTLQARLGSLIGV